jgi:hypothetical protein
MLQPFYKITAAKKCNNSTIYHLFKPKSHLFKYKKSVGCNKKILLKSSTVKAFMIKKLFSRNGIILILASTKL